MGTKKYIKEIINCFKEQYPEDWKRYESFFNNGIPGNSTLLIKEVLTYRDLLGNLRFLLNIVKELTATSGSAKKKGENK